MRWPAALLVVATLAACEAGQPLGGTFGGSAPRSTIPNETGVGPRSAFVLATPAGLLGVGADGKILGHILTVPQGSVPSAPALHPNGKLLYFVLSNTNTAESLGFGSNLYSVNIDGTDLRLVLKRDAPDVFYASPAFDARGNLYVHRRAAKQDPSNPGGYLLTEDSIERLDLGTETRKRVLADAAEPTVAPDGQTIVYVKIDRGQQTSLWTASTDGTGVRLFLKTGDYFTFLQAPRISPSGKQVIWSSAGRTSSGRPPSPSAARLAGGGKLAHLDIPSELYLAPLDGSSLRSIATTLDDVVPAWSPDGSKIAYVAQGTFWIISSADGAVLLHTEQIGVTYGDPVWLRPA